MDAAAAAFAALGFTLTPRGHHSLGSINHLMMTSGAYLELVGLPQTGLQRQDVLESPFGLNGLVLASDDIETTAAHLSKAGFRATPPQRFSRPVEIEGRTREACFETLRLPADTFAAGRVYFCRHLTPGYVWRPEWTDHPNGFVALDSLVVEGPDPAADARRYATACAGAASFEGGVGTLALLDFRLRFIEGPEARFTRLGLRFRELDVLERRAGALADVSWRRLNRDAAELILPDLRLHLDCRSVA